MAAAAGGDGDPVAMAGVGVWVTLLAAALMFSGAVLGSSPLVGAPRTVANPENSEGLQRALRFAMEEYNKASNDMYASRVVRIISAKEQVVAGINYIMKVEIARTTCPKPATDLQSCAFHDTPQMTKHTICNFVVYVVPWLNKVELTRSSCH